MQGKDGEFKKIEKKVQIVSLAFALLCGLI